MSEVEQSAVEQVQDAVVAAQIANLEDIKKHLRRSVGEEIGEDEEVSREERTMLMQKYGLMTPRIDRGVTKPNWMEVGVWKRKKSEWYELTKGMVAPQQQRNSRFPSKSQSVRSQTTTQSRVNGSTNPLPKPSSRYQGNKHQSKTRTSRPTNR